MPPVGKPLRPPKRKKKPKKPVDIYAASGIKTDKYGIPEDPAKGVQRRQRAEQQQLARRQKTILRRQRLLVSLGLLKPADVDGQWGPTSQRAWTEYVRQKRGGKVSVVYLDPVKLERSEARARRREEMARLRQQQAAQAKQAREARKRLRQQQKAIAARDAATKIRMKQIAIGKEVARLRAKPEAARNVNLSHLTEVLTNPESEFDATKREDTLIVQNWLQANGYKDLVIDGEWGKETQEALRTAYRKQATVERKRAIAEITRKLYGENGLRAGEKAPDWFPLGGKVPEPGELLDLMGQRGFTGDVLARAMAQHNQRFINAGLLQWRRDALRSIIARWTDNPLMVGTPGMILAGASTEVLIAEALGLGSRGLGQDTKEYAEYRAQIRSLMHARDGKDFDRKISGAIARADAKWEKEQAERMQKGRSIWGSAFHYIALPARVSSTLIVSNVQMSREMFGDALDAKWGAGGSILHDLYYGVNDDEGGFTDQVRANYEAAAGWKAEQAWYWNLAMELPIDPVLFARPIRIVSTVLRTGKATPYIGGYTIARLSETGGSRLPLIRGRLLERVPAGGRFLTYQNSKAPSYIKGAFGSVLERHAPVLHAMGGLKADAVGRATLAVSNVVIRGSEQLKQAHPAAAPLADFATKVPKRLVAQHDAGRAALSKILAEDEYAMAGSVRHLEESLVSLYSRVDREGPLSSVGASMKANYAEHVRWTVEVEIAQTSGDALYFSMKDEADELLEAGSISQAEHGNRMSEARVARDVEADRIRKVTGSYAKGSRAKQGETFTRRIKLDDGTQQMVEVEIRDEIKKRVQASLDHFEHDIIPALQDAVEQRLAARGISLWDDAGVWAGTKGASATLLKKLGLETFDNPTTIDNVLYNVELNYEQFIMEVGDQMSIAESRYMSWVAREKMAGRKFTDEEIRLHMEKVQEDIVKQFDELPGNRFIDKREKIEASALYTRNKDEAEGLFHQWSDMPADQIGRLARVLKSRQPTGIMEEELHRLSWNTGSLFKTFKKGDDILPKSFAKYGEESFEGASAEKLRNALGEAWLTRNLLQDSMTPFALYRERAVMAAWGKMNSLGGRMSYKAFIGITDAWKFAVLPFRIGWMVRNIGDNTLKLFLAGTHDPRAYFFGGKIPGALINLGTDTMRSVADIGIVPLRHVISLIDDAAGTQALQHFDDIVDTFWLQPLESLQQFFRANSLDVPLERLQRMQMDVYEQKVGKGTPSVFFRKHGITDDGLKQEITEYTALKHADPSRYRKAREGLWEIMGNRPEAYFRRVLYRDTYKKARDDLVARGVDGPQAALEAHDIAIKKIEDTLFDYSKITVLEDNLSFVFPFVQFFRKNTTFWTRTFIEHPYYFLALQRYEKYRDEGHADLPSWMRRYISAQEVTDAAAVVPGLGWLADTAVEKLGMENAMYDPLNFTSFAPLYRTYLTYVMGEDKNIQFPADRPATFMDGFFGPILDAVNDWGLGINPFIRKPLESAGVANYRAWQTIFPQTSLLSAFSRNFIGDWAGDFWLDLEMAFTLGLGETPSDLFAENFDEYVNKAMAEQAARDEPISRERAERVVKSMFWANNLFAYFSGVYVRRTSPEEVYMAKLAEDLRNDEKEWEDITDAEKKLMGIWGNRKLDRLAFDRYVEKIPAIQTYYSLDNWDEKNEYLNDHPEIIPDVDPMYRSGKPFTSNYAKSAALIMKGNQWYSIDHLARRGRIPPDVRGAADAVVVPPDLKRFWEKNDTPSEMQDKMVRGELQRHLVELNRTYFSIPESDFEAREDFLRQYPELNQLWTMNNSKADDYRALINQANADLRDAYFEILEEQGWEAAAEFLKEHSSMFEWTSAADRVDAKTGRWLPDKNTAKGRAFLAAQDSIEEFFAIMNGEGGKNAAFEFLRTPAGKAAMEYFSKYGKHTQKGDDYRKAVEGIELFFAKMDEVKKGKLTKGEVWDWLYSDDPLAKLARWYFAKHGKGNGTEHGRDFRAAKPALERYHRLKDADPDKAREWLASDSEAAKTVREYFEKWGLDGGHSGLSKAYLAAKPHLTLYYDLPAKQAKVWLDGDSAGAKHVRAFFKLYGHERGLNAQAHAYLETKPLLDRYGKMTKAQRSAFLKTPEGAPLLAYFKAYGHTARLEASFRKNHPALLSIRDAELKRRLSFWNQYFALEPNLRPAFVMKQAENHGIFIFGEFGATEMSDREQKFIRDAMAVKTDGTKLTEKNAAFLYVKPLLDQYYKLPEGDQRDLFLAANPELQHYFENYTHNSPTGNAKTDALVEAYFKLPYDSFQRSTFLKQHPEVQDYFDQHSTPQERAMRNLLEVYFALPVGDKRTQFLAQHPEISTYFDAKKRERDLRSEQLEPFEQADPSLRPFLLGAEREVSASAERRRKILRQARAARLSPDTLERRRERVTNRP